MTAAGQKQTSPRCRSTSALPLKTDIPNTQVNVGFVPIPEYVLAKIAAVSAQSLWSGPPMTERYAPAVSLTPMRTAPPSLAIAKTLGIFGGISCHCNIGGARRAQALDQ